MLDRIALILVIIGALKLGGLSACSATTLWLNLFGGPGRCCQPGHLYPGGSGRSLVHHAPLPQTDCRGNYDPLRACPRPAAFPAAAAAGFFIGRTSGILSEVFLNFL